MAKAALGAAVVATAAVAGAIMAIDNVFGLVPLPLFGIWGDRYRGRLGRRTPFILVVIAALVPKGDNPDYLPVCMIQALLIPGAAVCYGIDGSWELPYFDIGCDNFEARKDGLGEASPEAIDHMSPGVSAEKDSPGYRVSMLPNTQTLLSFEEAR